MAKKNEERDYEASKDRIFQAALAAIGRSGWSITHTDGAAGAVSFNTGRSMRSWAGQDMTVTVLPLGPQQSKLMIGGSLAKGGNPFGGGSQVAAWGEKKKIIGEFFRALDQALLADVPEAQTASANSSPADELSKLAELHKQGSLSDEEFQAAKTKLLS